MLLAPPYRTSYRLSPLAFRDSSLPVSPAWVQPPQGQRPDQYIAANLSIPADPALYFPARQTFANCFDPLTQPVQGAHSITTPLKAGDIAPDFTLNNQDNQPVQLYQELKKGRPVVLFFYPKDKSRYCTRQAQEFERAYPTLKNVCSVFGVSGDSEQSHREFIAANRLHYPLLSDPGDQVRNQFGAQDFGGWLPGRVTFVIQPDARIQMVYSSQTGISDHIQKTLQALGLPSNPFAPASGGAAKPDSM